MTATEDVPWTTGAVCASVDPELFYPPKGGDIRPAKRICAGCPVRIECAEYGITSNDLYGIYGGLTDRERRRLRRAGWKPGDQLPVPRTTRRTSGGHRTGLCLECGKSYARLDEHKKRRHGYLRGAA